MNNCENKSRYFAAINSGHGFVSFFEDIFFGEGISRRYIIKGGPGTGKSSFMKRVAAKAEGQGMSVEYYYCSSDTDSLDGLVIGGRIALLDGTAPHSFDAILPGACDEIVNLGEFWDSEKLGECSEKIGLLGEKKRKAYSLAYTYLSAAQKSGEAMKELTEYVLMIHKLKSAVHREFIKIGMDIREKGRITPRQCVGFGTRGIRHFDTLETLAEQRVYVDDFYGAAAAFMRELCDVAEKCGVEAWVSYDTLNAQTPTEIYFPERKKYFTIMNDKNISLSHNKIIITQRFVDNQALVGIRRLYRESERARDTLKALAAEALADAGKAHGELEEIYVSAMDFKRLSEYCERFCSKIK